MYAVGNSQTCYLNGNRGIVCELLNLPDPHFFPINQCEINYFCNDDGNCVPMNQSPLYNVACSNGQHCGHGLHCINKLCKICVEGEQIFQMQDELGVYFLRFFYIFK